MAKVFTITEGLENMGALKTGGQGSVYKGRRKGEIITAVKLLPTPIHTEDPNDKNFIDFQNEVNKLKKVNQQPNPNIVKILNSGITDTGSFPFIEMEFIEGPDLEELLKPPHDPVFTIKEAIKVAEHLSHALAHCHKLDVKHGDIKSNNVKFNKHTGNYVLLDFGLAAMSDEQRRTSLRHAGAIEFMAPEQSEGHLLFQSDIYSFGVILFELLAGVVPFPLTDKGESARNRVMLAHLETPPPDLRALRRERIPEQWSEQKQKIEVQVPEWMVSMIYRCLRKKPSERFANGKELHEYILLNSSITHNKDQLTNAEQVYIFQQQNEVLFREKEKLQETILKYQNEVAEKDRELQAFRMQLEESVSTRRKPLGAGIIITTLIALFSLGGLVYVLANKTNEEPVKKEVVPEKKLSAIGQYKVAAARAYFHNEPDESTRRPTVFLVTNEAVNALDEQNRFIYTEYTNKRNQVTKGWLRKDDLITLEEWNRRNAEKPKTPEEIYKKELQQAATFLENQQYPAALGIYRTLITKDLPEAWYHYGNMALQDQNPDIGCAEAYSYVERAAGKGHVPAISTLGFLYLFAENKAVLGMNNYNRCEFKKDFERAKQLLNEAASKGDEAAKKLLADFLNNPTQPPVQ